jgi:hypothetical protein
MVVCVVAQPTNNAVHTIAIRAMNFAASAFTLVGISGLVGQFTLISISSLEKRLTIVRELLCSSLPGSLCQLFFVDKQWASSAVSCSIG